MDLNRLPVLLNCPICSRDFELPKRYFTRSDDADFLPAPRLLSCLHTACHSCLEEMRERSTLGKVICPVCRQDESIKGVKYLPLDVSILSQILKATTFQVEAYCSRCYDEVPSYSWCISCSSALCEFHHQDHKLSIDTSRHELMTFKEISHRKVRIEPKLPPVACPEVLLQDCTVYCHTCKHLASVTASLQNHVGHSTEDCKASFPKMQAQVRTSHTMAENNIQMLNAATAAVRNVLRELDDEVDKSALEIEKEFESLRKEMTRRENEMLARLQIVADRKRQVLVGQLNVLTEGLEDCRHTSDMAAALLRDTSGGGGTPLGGPGDGRAAYLVAAADVIKRRMDALAENTKSLPKSPLTDSILAVSFGLAELNEVLVLASSYGCIQSSEDFADPEDGVGGVDQRRRRLTEASAKKAREKEKEKEKDLLHPRAPGTSIVVITGEEAAAEAEAAGSITAGEDGPILPFLFHGIVFSVKSELVDYFFLHRIPSLFLIFIFLNLNYFFSVFLSLTLYRHFS